MTGMFRDLKHAVRTLAKSYGFTAMAALMLAFGLGLVIFMFAAINGFFITDLPFDEPERIAHVEYANPKVQQDSIEINWYDYLELARHQRSFEALAAFSGGTINLSADEVPERYDGVFTSANAFEVLRVKPILGRTFLAGEDQPGAALPVLIGHGLWMNRFVGDPRVIGKQVRVNGRDATIVGVMPEGFLWPQRNQLWIPQQRPAGEKREEGATVEVFGRLKAGTDLAQARTDLGSIVAQLAADFPATNQDLVPVVKPYKEEFIGNQTKRIIGTMFAAVVLVLLIACTNVANLILARNTERTRELAVRTALGASRWQIVRAMLAEAMVIAVIGAALGLLIAHFGVVTIDRILLASEDPPPYYIQFVIDWRVVAFAFGAALLTGFIAGLLPALRASRQDVNGVLKDAGRGSAGQGLAKLTRALVVFEIAMSCVLLVAAGLTVRSTLLANEVEIGTRTDGLLTGRVGLFESAYPSVEDRRRFFERLQLRLAEVPGVTGAAITQSVPLSFMNFTAVLAEGATPPASNSDYRFAGRVAVSDGFFALLEVPLREGRVFDARDRTDTERVAVANRAFVARHLEGKPAVGARFRLGRADQPDSDVVTIVGVVGDVLHQEDLSGDAAPALYVPLAQSDVRFGSFVVASDGDPLALAPAVRRAVQDVDRDLPVYWLRTLDDWLELALFDHRLVGGLFSIFAVFALLLAAAGIYAVLAFAVGTRTREIGVRRALGAQDNGILRMVMGQGLVQLAVGLGVGVVLAALFAQLLTTFVVGVSTLDPITYAAVLTMLGLVTALACLVPALRALKVDPMEALRYE